MSEFPTIPGDWNIHYEYSVGKTAAAFFDGLKSRGVILGSRCDSCGRVLLPARGFCERCFVDTSDLVEVGPGGEVETFTLPSNPVVTRSGDHFMIALIKVDGADSGLVHFVDGLDFSDPYHVFRSVEAGLRVEAEFRAQEEREGHILDIACFRPVGAQSQ